MIAPDMTALVEWRPASPGKVHAIVEGDVLTLCGQLRAEELRSKVSPTGATVCALCVEITHQLATGLLAHVHQEQHP